MSRAEIDKMNQAFEEAANSGDASALAELYTEDAVVFPPMLPMGQGREEIQQRWAALIKMTGLKSMKTKTLKLEFTGEVGIEVGESTIEFSPASGDPTRVVVKYLMVWKQTANGWKLHRDIWNPNPPGPVKISTE